jgi:peptidoglycan-associated lipoprotein
MALGERRAKAVANYLSSQGVPASQIETVSYGEEKPAMLGGGSEAMAKNRRVELIYSE